MKTRRLMVATVMVFSFISRLLFAQSLPAPPVEFPFEVSKQGSTVRQEIRIREYRSYYFAVQIEAFSRPGYYRLLKLLTGRGRLPDPTATDHGINIPIHLEISREGKDAEKIFDHTVETNDIYAIGHANGAVGQFDRAIAILDLQPGVYRVEAATTKDCPQLAGASSQLLVEPHFQLRFIPNMK